MELKCFNENLQTNYALESSDDKIQNQFYDLFSQRNESELVDKSKLSIKRLIVSAISNILYLRNIFPEVAFNVVDYDGMKMKILKTETYYNKSAIRMINNLFEFFDKWEKGYADEIILNIYWQDNATEAYRFKICLFKENFELIMHMMESSVKIISIKGDERNFTKNMKILVRSIQTFSESRNLFPDGTMVDINLAIYNDLSKMNDSNVIKSIETLSQSHHTRELFPNFEHLCDLFSEDHLNFSSKESLNIMRQFIETIVSALLYFRKAFPNEASKWISSNDKQASLINCILSGKEELKFQVDESLTKFIQCLKSGIGHEIVMKISTQGSSEIHKLIFSKTKDKIIMTLAMNDKYKDFKINKKKSRNLMNKIEAWCNHHETLKSSCGTHILFEMKPLPQQTS